jgi:hypothetical protein
MVKPYLVIKENNKSLICFLPVTTKKQGKEKKLKDFPLPSNLNESAIFSFP